MNQIEKAELIRTNTKKGCNTKIVSEKPIETRDGDFIIKHSEYVGRNGIDYEKVAEVIAKKADNQGNGNGYNSPIKHADADNIIFKNEKTGKLFLRVYKASFDFKATSYFEYKGQTYSYEEMIALGIVAKSKLRSNSGEKPICWYVAVDDIKQVSGLKF